MCEMHVATVIEDTAEKVAFLGSLSADANDSPWMTDMHVENLNARFKIDTGADVTATSEMLYNQGQFSRLERSTRVLLGPGGSRLNVKGKFTATPMILMLKHSSPLTLPVPLQRQTDTEWKPVVYTWRALSSTDQRYAQIEKETLASTWACERFAEFLVGKSFYIETNHKPLISTRLKKIR